MWTRVGKKKEYMSEQDFVSLSQFNWKSQWLKRDETRRDEMRLVFSVNSVFRASFCSSCDSSWSSTGGPKVTRILENVELFFTVRWCFDYLLRFDYAAQFCQNSSLAWSKIISIIQDSQHEQHNRPLCYRTGPFFIHHQYLPMRWAHCCACWALAWGSECARRREWLW